MDILGHLLKKPYKSDKVRWKHLIATYEEISTMKVNCMIKIYFFKVESPKKYLCIGKYVHD